jgi:hypothetical protein
MIACAARAFDNDLIAVLETRLLGDRGMDLNQPIPFVCFPMKVQ